jgi:hypothetical protein
METEEDFTLYPSDEDFYEQYLIEIETGKAAPHDCEVSRRIFASHEVSPFDTKRQTVPYFHLSHEEERPNIRMRIAH